MWPLILSLKQLNLRNIIIAALIICCVILAGLWQFSKISNGKLKNEIASLQGMVDSLNFQIGTRDVVIEDLKKNLDSIKTAYLEMEATKSRATVIRKTIDHLVYVETGKACEAGDKLGEEYAKAAADIAVLFNTGVRGKVSSPRPDSSSTKEVLPKTN